MIKKLMFGLVLFFGMISLGYADLTNNNELYYSFDSTNTSGTTMFDLSINGNDGTCNGMTNCNTVTGLLNQSSSYDGTNDNINTGISNLGTVFSWGGWIKSNDVTKPNQMLMSNRVSKVNGEAYMQIASTIIRFNMIDNANSDTIVDYVISTVNNQWYHVIGTFDGTTMNLYVDGVLRGNTTVSGWDGATPTNIFTGHDVRALGWLDGQTDESSIWSRVLNSSEVSDLYNGGVGFNPYTFVPPTVPSLEFTNITLNNETLLPNQTIITM